MKDQLYIVREELEALAEKIRENHRKAGQVASGRTLRSIRVVMSENGGTLYGRAFFGTLETGRKGGRVPRNFKDIILQWMKDKGIHADDGNDKGMAWLIAQKIRKEGTALFRKGGRSDIYSKEIPITIENIVRRMSKKFSEEIEHINLNYVRE